MKLKIIKQIKQVGGTHLYFGFLAAFAMIAAFFMFRFIFGAFMKNIYSTLLSFVIYLLFLYGAYYYSEPDKELRILTLGSTIILWAIYFIMKIIIY